MATKVKIIRGFTIDNEMGVPTRYEVGDEPSVTAEEATSWVERGLATRLGSTKSTPVVDATATD